MSRTTCNSRASCSRSLPARRRSSSCSCRARPLRAADATCDSVGFSYGLRLGPVVGRRRFCGHRSCVPSAAPQAPHPPLEQEEDEAALKTLRELAFAERRSGPPAPARTLSTSRRRRSWWAPPSQNAQGPCAGGVNPTTRARRWATSQKNSTGASGSPCSSSLVAAQAEQKRADVAVGALGGAGGLLVAHLGQKALPPLLEAPLPQIELVAVRQHADAHLPFRIDGEGVDPAAALVDLVARRRPPGAPARPARPTPRGAPDRGRRARPSPRG